MDLDQPVATTEFLVVDTETNGLAGDACELTEVGAVLVGGGELHERWETLLTVRAPLSRGIQRFTGITQAMVDEAPPAEAQLPELAAQLRGRVLVAHSASFDRRVLRQAFERAGLRWPNPPQLCTVALARRLHPLARQRRLRALAESLGIEVEVSHRALADAETCARVFCALFPRLCAHALTVARGARTSCGPRARGARGPRPPTARRARSGARRRLPDLGHLTDDPGVYVVRNADGQVVYVGKSVSVRSRARAHFAPSSHEGAWVEQAETVEHERTNSELGALLLESRLIKRLRPPGNARLKHVDRYVYLRCRLDIAFPVLEVAPAPAAGRGVSVGPLRGRAAAVELLEQLNSLFGLRHCGAQAAAALLAQSRLRADGPLPVAVPGRPRPQPLPPPPRRGAGAVHRRRRRRRRAAGPPRRADARRRGRAELRARRVAAPAARAPAPGCSSAWAASSPPTHARPRLVLAEHPRGGRCDAFWLVGGRVVDWGPPGDLDEVMERTVRALRGGDGTGATACLAPDEVDEARIVATWLDGHDALELDLHGGADRAAVARLLASAHDDGHAHAGRMQRADDAVGAGADQPAREHAA